MSPTQRVVPILAVLAFLSAPACSVHLGGWDHHDEHCVVGSGVEATVTRELPAFTRVEVAGAMTLVVDAGPPAPVEVTGDDNILPHLRIEVVNDTLVVRPRHSISPRRDIVVRATAPALRRVEASGATEVVVRGLDVSSLEIDVSGASEVTVEGRCGRLDAEATGASALELRGLSVLEADVEASGASDVDVHVDEDLQARVSGAASVRNHGPGVTRGHVSGAGSLRPHLDG